MTCATSTCTRPSPRPTAAAGRAAGVVRRRPRSWPASCRCPLVEFDGERYYLDYDRPDSIGKIGPFYGNAPVMLKAYAWVMSLGAEGLREVAEIAVLNNNYLLKKMLEIPGVSAPYAQGKRRIEQVRYSWQELAEETGVHSEEIGLRAADFGVHYWTSHHPFVVPEPCTLEPTESYSKEELDEYAAILAHVAEEARSDPELVKTRAAQQHHPHHRPRAAGRSGAVGDDLAGVSQEKSGSRSEPGEMGRTGGQTTGLDRQPGGGHWRAGGPQGQRRRRDPAEGAGAGRRAAGAGPGRSRRWSGSRPVEDLEIVTYPGEMGEDAARACGFEPTVVGAIAPGADDGRGHPATPPGRCSELGVDLLLFAGGDGTARDIYEAVGLDAAGAGHPGRGQDPLGGLCHQPAQRRASWRRSTSRAASRSLREAEVMDIDEEAFRQGALSARLYGYLQGALPRAAWCRA